MKRLATIAVIASLVALSGCGGDRPSEDDLYKSISSTNRFDDLAPVENGEGLPEKQERCLAKAMHDSELSDETLNAFVAEDSSYAANAKEKKIVRELSPKLLDC